MRDIDLQRCALIYENAQHGISVYKGHLKSSQIPVAIKDQLFRSLADANFALSEALHQNQLSHPHIVKIYGMCLSEQSGNIKVTIAFECLDRDLYKEISNRAVTKSYWTEEELIGHLKNLVDALALAQRAGVSHRDIKPQNVFVGPNEVLKIGDFGSALSTQTAAELSATHTIQGSPYFLSPVLKKALLSSLMSPSPPEVCHNVYKSDMYSLGVTFLYMSALSQIDAICNLEDLETVTGAEIEKLSYSGRLKSILRSMLAVEEADRMDFLTLESYLRATSSDLSTHASTNTTLATPPDLQILISSLNQEAIQAEALSRAFELNIAMLLSISLPLKCFVCNSNFTVDITYGTPDIAFLYVCSEMCYQVHITPTEDEGIPNETAERKAEEPECEVEIDANLAHSKALNESLQVGLNQMKEQKICIICAANQTVDGLVCAKCLKKQQKGIESLKTSDCAFCHNKWHKQGKLSKLFQKRKKVAIKLQPCKDKMCSITCLQKSLQISPNCPKCHRKISAEFVKYMKLK